MAGGASADFDGDGRSDFSVYRFDEPAAIGSFSIERSELGPFDASFGGAGDRPIVGDYDGDGRDDVAVYGFSPADGFARFGVLPSSGAPAILRPFGGADDLPVAGDFDGDGVVDIAVFGFSPANGFARFAALLSGGPNEEFPGGVVTLPFGGADDRPIAGDFDGDGLTDFGVYGFVASRGFSRFSIRLSGGPNPANPDGIIDQPFGGFDDLPVVGDFDGDGLDDFGIFGFSPAEGFARFGVKLSGGDSSEFPAGVIARPFGGPDDIPVAGDFDGDGLADVAVHGFSEGDGVYRFAVLPSAGGPASLRPMGEAGSIAMPPPPLKPLADADPIGATRSPFRIEWVDRGGAGQAFSAAEEAVIDRAIELWEGLIVDNGRPENSVRIRFLGGRDSGLDLGGSLGLATVDYDALGPTEATIRLDADAAGFGWFVDPTPGDNVEFATMATPSFRVGGPGRFDFFTTVVHEMGHALGLGIGFAERLSDRLEPTDGPGSPWLYRGPTGVEAVLTPDLSHLDEDVHAFDLMNHEINPGVRALPSGLDLRLLADAYGYRVVMPPETPDRRPPHALGAEVRVMADGSLDLAVGFDEGVDVLAARDPDRYTLYRPDGDGNLVPVVAPFVSTEFYIGRLQARLKLRDDLRPGPSWRLRVSGEGPSALADVSGNPLDGDGDGLPGGDALLPIVG